jgi:hypothetical protein
VTTGDNLSVTLRAFGMAEAQLFYWCRVKSGARVKTGDLGAPVDLIVQALKFRYSISVPWRVQE